MRRVLAAVFSLSLGGCAHYTARPLTHARIQRALAVRPANAFWVKRARMLLPALPKLVVRAGEPLSPNLAAVVAVVADPSLRALRQQRAIANAQVLTAGLLPNPTFSYGVGIPLSGAGLTDAFRAGLGLPIRAFITRGARLHAARLHAQDIDLGIAWQEWQVASRAKTLVLTLQAESGELRLLTHEVRALSDSVALLSDAEAAGYATLGVAGAARLTLHQTQLSRLAVRQRMALEGLQLRALLGVGAHAPLKIARPAHAKTGQASCLASRFWLHGLTSRRLDLLAMRRGYRSSNAALRAAIAGQFPAITIGLNRARDTSAINTLGTGVSMELPFFNHNQGAIAQAKATRRALFHRYVARVFTARAQIHQLLSRMHYLHREIQDVQSSVSALQHLEHLYHTALGKQRIAALTYYQLLGKAVSERLLLLQDRSRMNALLVALETASGRFERPMGCAAKKVS